MISPLRIPVKAEEFLINSIGICWPHIQNEKIRFSLNVLAEQLKQELDRKNKRKISKEKQNNSIERTEGDDIRKFIAMFKDRYIQETDMEYRKINQEEIGSIKNIIKKLRDKKIEIGDYLDWVFDVFFDDAKNREKFSPPMIKFICCSFLISKYFMSNRDKIKKKKATSENINRRENIRNYAKDLYDRTKNIEIKNMIQREFDGTITVEYLENWIMQTEKKYQEENSNE